MTIKLALLKSGEDVIADMEEMVANDQVVGYFLKYPCVAKLVGNDVPTDGQTKEPFKLRLTPAVDDPFAKFRNLDENEVNLRLITADDEQALLSLFNTPE